MSNKSCIISLTYLCGFLREHRKNKKKKKTTYTVLLGTVLRLRNINLVIRTDDRVETTKSSRRKQSQIFLDNRIVKNSHRISVMLPRKHPGPHKVMFNDIVLEF